MRFFATATKIMHLFELPGREGGAAIKPHCADFSLPLFFPGQMAHFVPDCVPIIRPSENRFLQRGRARCSIRAVYDSLTMTRTPLPIPADSVATNGHDPVSRLAPY